MKPKLKDYIPAYGLYSYFNRYWDAEKRTMKEATTAQWFQIYQITVLFLVCIFIIKLFIILN